MDAPKKIQSRSCLLRGRALNFEDRNLVFGAAPRTPKNAIMTAKDATMSDHERQGRHLKFSKPGPRFWGRVLGVRDRVYQLLSCTPPSPPSEALPLSRLAFST